MLPWKSRAALLVVVLQLVSISFVGCRANSSEDPSSGQNNDPSAPQQDVLQPSGSEGGSELSWRSKRRGLAYFIGSKIALARLTEEQRCALSQLTSDDVLVSRGDLDNVELVLEAAGLNFTHIEPTETDFDTFLQPCRTLFVNSGSTLVQNLRSKQSKHLDRQMKRFVRSGGVVVTTDWAITLMTTPSFASRCWSVRTEAASSTANVLRLERSRNVERVSLNETNRCTRDSGLVEMVEEIALFLESLNLAPSWHLLESPLFSKLVKFSREACAKPRRAPSCLLQSDDLPMSENFDCTLYCQDMRQGSYFHVVGPLAQTTGGSYGRQPRPLTVSLLRLLADQLPNLSENELTRVIPFLRYLAQAGYPLTVDDLGSAAISSSLVLRLVLKTWLPACVNAHAPPTCSNQSAVHPSPAPRFETTARK